MNTQPKQSTSLDQRAREILGDEYKRTHDANPRVNLDEATYGLALRAVTAALSAQSRATEVVDRALAYLRPHLEAGTFAAPDWAIALASILTDGKAAPQSREVQAVDTAFIEKVAEYAWMHASWDWAAVKAGLDRFATTPQDAAGVLGVDVPPKVFSSGQWTWNETGEKFSGADLDGAAFARYRELGLLATTTTQNAAGVEGRCSRCDGTGDIHRADGEYVGVCDCTQQPGADVGKLRELEFGWRQQAADARAYAKRLATGKGCSEENRILADQSFERANTFDSFADELAGIIYAAAPGVQT